MTFDLQRAVQIAFLERKAILEASKDEQALQKGISITVISGLIVGALKAFQGESAFTLILSPIGALIGVILLGAPVHWLAKLFGGKAAFGQIIRPLFYTSIISWLVPLQLLPLVGKIIAFVLSIWMLSSFARVAKEVHEISLVKAAVCVIIPIVIFALIALIYEIVAPTLY
ncbi:YIP1 family protein [Candidatus Woesearchaeota archaeon]|nr:YIP1 family protein [Candidatus Woesearchaeota archaeon]